MKSINSICFSGFCVAAGSNCFTVSSTIAATVANVSITKLSNNCVDSSIFLERCCFIYIKKRLFIKMLGNIAHRKKMRESLRVAAEKLAPPVKLFTKATQTEESLVFIVITKEDK